jgi:dTMP kinase
VPRGKYIVIEGNDGTGKSTQVEKIRERLQEHDIKSIEFHEPAGTPIADAIRTIIKDGNLERTPETNLLLFTAARHEIWHMAEQKLSKGTWVVAARNYYSTLAYQGYGEGLALDLIEDTMRTFTSEQYMNPDIAVILSVDDATRQRRIAKRGRLEHPDTFESRGNDYQQRLNDGYIKIAASHNLPIIDAAQPIRAVTDDIWRYISSEIKD